jgi:hypothetical protein
MPQGDSVSFENGVLERELGRLSERRIKLFGTGAPAATEAANTNGDMPEVTEAPSAALRNEPNPTPNGNLLRIDRAKTAYAGAHKARPFGLSFSGGGIRSATFNLGIAQGLAEKGILPYVDYLSTVSGGGYIGSWLHGVIRKQCGGDPRIAASHILSPSSNPIPDRPKEDPITFLRKYSNYLAPKPGAFTADSWVIPLIWLRNVALNQLILVPAIAAILLAILLGGMTSQAVDHLRWDTIYFGVDLIALAGAVIPLAIATTIMGANLNGIALRTFPATEDPPPTQEKTRSERLVGWIIPLVFLSAVMTGCGYLDKAEWSRWGLRIGLAGLFALFQFQGGFRWCFERLHDGKQLFLGLGANALAILHSIWMIAAAALLSSEAVAAVWRWTDHVGFWVQLTFAPVLVCFSLLTGVGLLIGLMGADYPDASREWLARLGAVAALVCILWMALFGVAVWGPFGIAWVLANYGGTGTAAIGTWIAATVAGVLAGKSSTTGATDEPVTKGPSVIDRILGFVPLIFMLGYLLLISYGVHAALRRVTPPVLDPLVTHDKTANWLTRTFTPVSAGYPDLLRYEDPTGQTHSERLLWMLALLTGCAVVTAVASSRININEFSLHHFYKNRLVRCYLGASNSKERRPNPFTGFDPADDFPVSALVPTAPPHAGCHLPESHGGYYGPYAIVNAALNLNAGSELAQQERKATSFVFTPEFCGFTPTAHRHVEGMGEHGYRPTLGYAFPQGPGIGTTVAISGAAANPNSGYHTSGTMAFLLTIFDARLGWWLGNPRWNEASKRPGPLFALRYLFWELLGQTTGESKFVNLSDGGHFENLGLYELVRRRCRYIIVGDGEQDGGLTFGSLGQAIRMCRADFGVEIDINTRPIRLDNGYSSVHCVVGKIQYPEPETGLAAGLCDGSLSNPVEGQKAVGWLLYLKSSLTGDEPMDVVEYRSRFPEFPHQSTADQFFTESQFESYRRLGLHVVRDAFQGVTFDENGDYHERLLHVFQSLTRKWYANIVVTPEAASRLADQYSALMERLSRDEKLRGVYADELLPEEMGGGRKSLALHSRFDENALMFGLEIIQLMENVYTEFHLEYPANRANPRNAGWMKVFGRWAKSEVLYDRVWQRARRDYNPLFQQFMDDLRTHTMFDVPMRP